MRIPFCASMEMRTTICASRQGSNSPSGADIYEILHKKEYGFSAAACPLQGRTALKSTWERVVENGQPVDSEAYYQASVDNFNVPTQKGIPIYTKEDTDSCCWRRTSHSSWLKTRVNTGFPMKQRVMTPIQPKKGYASQVLAQKVVRVHTNSGTDTYKKGYAPAQIPVRVCTLRDTQFSSALINKAYSSDLRLCMYVSLS